MTMTSPHSGTTCASTSDASATASSSPDSMPARMAKSKRRPGDKIRLGTAPNFKMSQGHAVDHLIFAAGQEAAQVRLDNRHDALLVSVAEAADERGDEDI